MAFEAAFGIAAFIAVCLFFMHARLRKKYDALSSERDVLSAKMEVMEKDMPAITRDAHAVAAEPMGKIVEELRGRIETLTMQNAESKQAFSTMADTHASLAKDTKAISDMLASTQRRGRYSEIAVERILQMSGFERGRHYDVQHTAGSKRPDFVVHLPDNRDVILDSKAPLDALQRSISATDEAAKAEQLEEHVKAVKSHIRQLSNKEYWKGGSALECVVMVMPEYAMLPALERDDKLIEYAWENRIVLATPSILMILLRAVDIIWKQNSLSDTAKEIGELSGELHSRLVTFAERYAKTRKGLDSAVKSYNDSVGSWESRVKPGAERLAKAGAVLGELPDVKPIDNAPRRLSVDE